MKANRLKNLCIVEQSENALRTEYSVKSDTDRWLVCQSKTALDDREWSVTHQGLRYRPVTLTLQGQTILEFVKIEILFKRAIAQQEVTA